MKRKPKRKGTRRRRWLRTVLLVLLVVEGIYLAAGNFFLVRYDLKQKINHRPEKVTVDWSWLWTPLPGVVVVDDLSLRGKARRVLWDVEVDDAVAVVGPIALTERTFRTPWLLGSGLTLNLRQRTPPAPPPARSTRPPWTIALDRVLVTDLREIRIDEYRLLGSGRASGSLHFVVRGPLRIDALRLRMPDAELRSEADPIARRLDLDADLAFAPFLPREHRGLRALPFLSGDLRMRGEVPTIAFLNGYLGNVPWLRLHGGGEIAGDLHVERGKLTDGSRIRIESPAIGANVLGWEVDGTAAVDGLVQGQGADATTTLRVEFHDLAIREPGVPDPVFRGDRFEIVATAADADVVDGFVDPTVTIDLPAGEVPELGFLNPYFPPQTGLSTLSGRGRLRAHLRVEHGLGSGELDLGGSRIGADTADGTRVEGDAALHLRFTDGDLTTGRFEIAKARLAIENLKLPEMPRSSINGWWAGADLTAGTVVFRRPLSARGHLGAVMRDSRPVMALFLEKKKRLQWLERVLVIRDLNGEADVALSRSAITVDHLVVTSPQNLEILAHLRFSDAPPEGLLYARYGRLAAGVRLHDGKRDWKLRGARKWFESQPTFGSDPQ